jgi:hypothetical protein
MHAPLARRRGVQQFPADGMGRAEQPAEAADIDRDEIVAMTLVTFVPGGKLCRECGQCVSPAFIDCAGPHPRA